MWKSKLTLLVSSCALGAAQHQDQPPASITIPPQTILQTGPPIQTTYHSVSDLTANSVTTTVVGGVTTVLPVWYCAPGEMAAACKHNCPQTSTIVGNEASCEGDFNAIILLPLVAAPGVFLPPPEGLPTLTIDNGEPKTFSPKSDPTPEPKPQTSSTPVPISTPIPFDDSPPEVSCVAPTNKVDGQARPAITTESLGGTATQAPDGGVEGRYFSGGFYQNGDTFARTDGISALNQFCVAHAKNGSVLGPDGAVGSGKPGWSKQKAQHIYQGDFNTKNSGKITVRAIYDIDNRISKLNKEKDCNNNGDDKDKVWLIGLFQENACRNYLGQTIDFCDVNPEDMGRSSSDDTAWKRGGTYYHRCGIWELFKTPDSGSTRPLKPEEVFEAPPAS
ncbi:Nn.00g031510.m01.CDS01 [Neocucurbitaria sp. VM-36]